jgi:hypothetical protein
MEGVKQANPKFAGLLDIISSTYQEDGFPKQIKLQLKQVRGNCVVR